MKFRIVAVLGVLASLVAAQGVLTYPDVFYYKFNEGSGQQVVNHAIPGGALYQPTFENANPLQWDNTTPALGGSAWKPAGLNRLLSNGPTKINQSYTIECWFKTPAAYVSGNLQRLFGDYSVSTFRAYIGFYGPGAYYLGGNVGTPALCAGCTTAQASAGVSANVYDGNWHHLALVLIRRPERSRRTSTATSISRRRASSRERSRARTSNSAASSVRGPRSPAPSTSSVGGEKRVHRRRFRRPCRRNSSRR